MGGGIAGPELAGAVAAAGGLGTLGLTSPKRLCSAVDAVRVTAPGRAVAVNLLMPFVRRAHVDACLAARVDVAVLFYGGSRELVTRLRAAQVFVLVQVGTRREAEDAVRWGADGLIAQGLEAGGHLLGRQPALDFLGTALGTAGHRPVFVAGGIATGADVAAALAAGAAGAVAGTRFLLTHESGAHRSYQQRVLAATETMETTLFGFGWPARHRVVPNEATARWLHPDGTPRSLLARLNRTSSPLSRVIPDGVAAWLPRVQRNGVPLLSPAPPLVGMSPASVAGTPLYAGESALRVDSVVSAAEAVAMLSPPAEPPVAG